MTTYHFISAAVLVLLCIAIGLRWSHRRLETFRRDVTTGYRVSFVRDGKTLRGVVVGTGVELVVIRTPDGNLHKRLRSNVWPA